MRIVLRGHITSGNLNIIGRLRTIGRQETALFRQAGANFS